MGLKLRIEKVSIENFGCIESVSVSLGAYVALIGPNNAGKSTILKAIDAFFSSAPKIERRHYFRHELDRVIAITIMFGELTPVERQEFGNAVIDGKMTVTRTFGGEFDGLFSVDALIYPGFSAFREEKNGTKQRALYPALRTELGLPAVSAVAEMEEAMKAWENINLEKLEKTKLRGFFGAANVAIGKLRKKTSVRFVSAVSEVAEETSNPKSSPIIAILSDIRRQTLENKPEFHALITAINENVSNFVGTVEDSGVEQLGGAITEILAQYYSDTVVSAELPPPNELSVTFPAPALKIRHRAISDGVENVGHGLQRAVLFSVVQYLAQHFARANEGVTDDESKSEAFSEAASDIIILIEEPEIYQHPLKQRIIRDVLDRICQDFDRNTGIRLQVVICTHSEKFIRIRDIDALRVVRTTYVDDAYSTTVRSLRLENLRDLIHVARGGVDAPMALPAFGAGLHVFSEAVSEGFFSEKVVLVEGVGDVAAVEGAFLSKGRDAQMEGIAIIQVDGKTKLDKPLQAYLSLGIKAYCIFDNDQSKSGGKREQRRKYNHILQRICEVTELVDFPEGVGKNFAAIAGNLEQYFSEVLKDKYHSLREQVAESFGVDSDDMAKSPATISALITLATGQGYEFKFFDDVVSAIDAL